MDFINDLCLGVQYVNAPAALVALIIAGYLTFLLSSYLPPNKP